LTTITTSTTTTLYPLPTLTQRSLPLHNPIAPPPPPCNWSSPVIPVPWPTLVAVSKQASKQARPTDRQTATARPTRTFLPSACTSNAYLAFFRPHVRLFRTVVVFSTMVLTALCE
jgi:hypothetical protein